MKYLYKCILNGGYCLYSEAFDIITTIENELEFRVSVLVNGNIVENALISEPMGVKWEESEFEKALEDAVVNFHMKYLTNRF